jgi:hypothetical protein
MLKNAKRPSVSTDQCKLDIEKRLPQCTSSSFSLRILEGIESFVCVADEWQTHFRILLGWDRLCLSLVCSGVVFLWNFIDWKIADINVRRKLRLEWCSDATKLVPYDPFEEWVLLDL